MSTNEQSIEQYELAERLTPLVVGRKVVAVKGATITLDNGTQIKIEGSSDCCAYGDAELGELVDSEHVITAVESEEDGDEEKARVFLLANTSQVMQINQEWNSSNGYYFYGLHLTVTEVAGL